MAFSSPVKHVFPRKKIRKKKNRTTHLTWDISFWRQSVSLYFSFFFRTNVTPPNLRFPNSHMTEREKLNNSIWSEKKVLLRASSVWHFVFFSHFLWGTTGAWVSETRFDSFLTTNDPIKWNFSRKYLSKNKRENRYKENLFCEVYLVDFIFLKNVWFYSSNSVLATPKTGRSRGLSSQAKKKVSLPPPNRYKIPQHRTLPFPKKGTVPHFYYVCGKCV